MLKRQEEDVKTKKLEEAAKDMISGKIPGLRQGVKYMCHSALPGLQLTRHSEWWTV